MVKSSTVMKRLYFPRMLSILCTLLFLFRFGLRMRDFSLKLRRVQLFNLHTLCHTVACSHVSLRWDTRADTNSVTLLYC